MQKRKSAEIALLSKFDLTRIDMTGTSFEKEYQDKPLTKGYKKLNKEILSSFDFEKIKKVHEDKIKFFSGKELKKYSSLSEKILHIITSKRYRNGSLDTINLKKYKGKFLKKINQNIKEKRSIEIMMPAFPFKIKNPLKSQRGDADLAEIGAFLRFHEINLQIKKIYSPGAKFFIFHDGHLYYKYFLHRLSDTDKYLKSLKKFLKKLNLGKEIIILDISKKLKKIKDFGEILKEAKKEMANMWKYKKYDEKIQKIISSSKKNLNLSHIAYEKLNHIFLYDDWDLEKDEKVLKDIIKEKAEKTAFEYMVIQHALEKAKFFEKIRPLAIRATVHPKEGQIGLFLVKRKTHLLPWMGVGILKSNGMISVRYERELIDNEKYVPVFLKGEKFPFFYKEAEVIYEGTEQFKKLFNKITEDLERKDCYWAFAFKMEYHNEEITDFLKKIHDKLKQKRIDDRLLGSKQVKKEIKNTFKYNKNIKLRFTNKTTPVGVIILKDRIIHLIWGDFPSAYEIHSKQIVDQYKRFFKEIWNKSKN